MFRRIGAMVVLAIATPALAGGYADVQRRSLYVPVRDGTKIAVNLYTPADGAAVERKPLPVVFVFTPYRARFRAKDGAVKEVALEDNLGLRSLIAAGYVVAVADIRGKGASFGSRRGFQDRTEAQDGHDLVEWLAHQPFATGKVGMIGCSYLGGTTFHTATTAPPSLKAVFVGASDLDKYAFVRRGGITAQFNTRPDEPLSDDLASLPVDGDAEGTQLKAAVEQHARNTPMAALWYGMPYRDSVSALTDNRFWEEVGVYRYLDAIKRAGIATYFWGNWHDEPTAQSILSAANLPGSKFLAGPGSHCVPPSGFDLSGEIVRYFDHYLKGTANGIEKEPRATYWIDGLDGKGGYARSESLPGAAAVPRKWYLTGEKSGTARSANDGTLAGRPAAPGEDRFIVRYDLPDADYFAFWAQPMDDKGLSYTSAALDTPLKLIGFPIVRLRVSADKPDADVFVYLDQVAADGTAEVVSFGRLALSHRKTSKPPYATMGLPWHSGRGADVSPLPLGQSADLAIDLTPVSRIVPAGARLRLTIAGADPRQRDLKQIQQTPAPVITVERGAKGTSWIQLPIAD